MKVFFFAALREQLGSAGEEMELPAGITTLGGLREHLRARGGNYAKAFAEKALVRMAVNHEVAKPGATLGPGDEVAFFPPVTGG